MRFQGRVYKNGGVWLAEVPVIDAMTQGRTRIESLEMIQDWFATMVNKRGFAVSIHLGKFGEFEVDSDDVRAMISLLLERRRQQSGLSLAEAAERLRVKSRNAYARYERGESVPTLEKLDRLLKAVSRERGLVLTDSVV